MKKFDKLADDLIRLLDITPDENILDFGCATGGLVHALKTRGIADVKGTDISYWAINYGKEYFELCEELEYHNLNLLASSFSIILFLDVLEHVPSEQEIRNMLGLVEYGTTIAIRVPVSAKEGEPYVLEVSRNDATHVQCHTKRWWDNLLHESEFVFDKVLRGRAIYESKGVFARCYEKSKRLVRV